MAALEAFPSGFVVVDGPVPIGASSDSLFDVINGAFQEASRVYGTSYIVTDYNGLIQASIQKIESESDPEARKQLQLKHASLVIERAKAEFIQVKIGYEKLENNDLFINQITLVISRFGEPKDFFPEDSSELGSANDFLSEMYFCKALVELKDLQNMEDAQESLQQASDHAQDEKTKELILKKKLALQGEHAEEDEDFVILPEFNYERKG
ncbi:MAG: hypothetical protein KAR79_00280 [Simkaniaceae bacterium]|nr:hypothetical protein [Simkaniaceae bacterium]